MLHLQHRFSLLTISGLLSLCSDCKEMVSSNSLAVLGPSEPHRERIIPAAGATEQSLITYLLTNYDTDARGVKSSNTTVTVEVQFLLLRIQSLDERSQVLTTTGLLICDWQDDRLRWSKEKFENINDIVIKPERIWLPELALMNGADELAPDFRKIRILIRHDGHVHWEPGGVLTTTCDINIRYFPFDDQYCPIQFGAWAYYSARMNITNAANEVQTHDFRLNGEWDIYQTKAEWKENVLPCCPDTRYSYVEFTLYLRRRYAFYVMNIILPCSLLSVLVMVAFCLPPDAGEKISLGISVLLAFTVFLLMVAENVPRTSLDIPVIVIYLTCTMALGTVSVCLTVFVLNLHHRDAECPVPRWVRVFVLQYLAKALCVGARKPQTMAENLLVVSPGGSTVDLQTGVGKIARGGVSMIRPDMKINGYVGSDGQLRISGIRKGDHTHEWKEVAHVLDRLFFWLVFLFMTASAMIIVLVPCYKEEPKV